MNLPPTGNTNAPGADASGSPGIETMNLPTMGNTFSLGLTKRPRKTLRDHLTNRRVQLWTGGGIALFITVIFLAAFSGGTIQKDKKPQPDKNPSVAAPASKPPPLAVSPFDRKGDHALSFDGKDDYVEIPTLKYDGSYPLTIEATVICRRIAKNLGGVAAIFGNGSRSLISYRNSDIRFWAVSQIAASGKLQNSQTIQSSVVFGRKVHLGSSNRPKP